MKILQINKLYSPWSGGVESHVQQISEKLQERNLEVQVLCCNTKLRTKNDLVNNIPVLRAGSLGIFFSMPLSFSFFYYLKKQKADILHFHLPNPLAVLAYLLVHPKGKLIVTWHSDIVKQKFFLFFLAPFIHSFLKKAHTIIVSAPQNAKYSPFLIKHFDKIQVVPFGINPKNYKLPPKKKLKTPYKFILFAGRLVYYKGVHVLLQALQKTKIKLIIIGQGPEKSKLTRFAKKHLAKNQVQIIPSLPFPDYLAYLHACEFFVLPSTHKSEAFGLVQLDAMACKKPVICTNLQSGVPFVNKDGESGLVVEPNNVPKLREAIKKIHENDQLKKEFGRQAYRRVCRYFNEEIMVNKIEKIYYS